jgi:hypothetical protein
MHEQISISVLFNCGQVYRQFFMRIWVVVVVVIKMLVFRFANHKRFIESSNSTKSLKLFEHDLSVEGFMLPHRHRFKLNVVLRGVLLPLKYEKAY